MRELSIVTTGPEKILALLKKRDMTARELADILSGQMSKVSVYTTLLRMLKMNLVSRAKVPTHSYIWKAR